MPDTSLPPTIETFLRDHVETLQELELLTVLINAPDRWWDAAAVGRLIGADPAATRAALERLASRNLLAITISSEVRYRFQPGTPALRHAADAFAEALRTHGLAVYRFVAGTSNRAIRDFADAFRFRRDDSR